MTDISRQLQDYLSRNDVRRETKFFGGESLKKLLGSSTEDSADTTGNSNQWIAEAEKDSCLPSLSKKQRIVGFMAFIAMGIFCLTLAGMYAPFLVLKARKFALLYTMGSLFIISSFALLWGPTNHIKHLFSKERLPFTLTYFGTSCLTLYFALWERNTLLTAIFAVCQLVSLLWYIVSYIPGGQTGLRFFSKIFTSVVTRTASKALPV
ncbi:uncharacterized protein LOC135371186 [Ornithodoros turicata]|uniref:Vesicle transport protein n=1 Tax=Ornithodoros turicata TaxID=34597 RepID=A0A2R5LDC2_9ACAR